MLLITIIVFIQSRILPKSPNGKDEFVIGIVDSTGFVEDAFDSLLQPFAIRLLSMIVAVSSKIRVQYTWTLDE